MNKQWRSGALFSLHLCVSSLPRSLSVSLLLALPSCELNARIVSKMSCQRRTCNEIHQAHCEPEKIMNYSHFSLWYVQYAIRDKCREISSPLLSWLNSLGTFRSALAEWEFRGCHHRMRTLLCVFSVRAGGEDPLHGFLLVAVLVCVIEGEQARDQAGGNSCKNLRESKHVNFV